MRKDSTSSLRLLAGIALAAVLLSLFNLFLEGNAAATLGLVLVILLLGVSLLRPTLSLYALVFFALAIEQHAPAGSWTEKIPYHVNVSGAYPMLSGLSMNPLEVHLLFIIVGLLLRHLILRQEWAPILVPKSLLLYIGSIIFFIAYGVFRGGSMFPALWETRGILYLAILMLVVPQIVRTRKQVNHVFGAIIAGITFRILEVNFLYASAGFSLEGSDGMGNHEDAGFFAVLVVFAIALYALKVENISLRKAVTVLVIPALIAIVASDRRTAYPVIGAAAVLLVFLLSQEAHRKLMRYAWKAVIVAVLYIGVGWNVRGSYAIFGPVKNIREGLAGDEAAEAGASYTSNLYRKVENYDLYRMAREQPILGYGYGSLVDYFLPVPVTWDLGVYIPHNQILGVLAKTGIVGFTIFIYFYLSILAEIGRGFKESAQDPYLQAVLAFVGAAIVNHIVFSFFDIILTYFRCNILLGTLLGITASILTLQRSQAKDTEKMAPPNAKPHTTPARWLLEQHKEDASSVHN